jgi:hypothetical protein
VNNMETFVCSYLDCCSFSTTINDKELVDLTDDEINTILKPILCFLVEKSDKEERRRDNYASLVVGKIDFLDLDDNEYDEMYMNVYNKAYNEEYTIDKLKDEINNETDLAVLQMLYEELLSELGKYEDLGFCEQCCSYNGGYTYTVEL